MNIRTGKCALTHKEGKYVDAHILPKALTKPAIRGSHLLQSTHGRGYRKRFSSWYDKQLVTREGEEILSRIDDKGIKALRKNMLVWSSWRAFIPHFEKVSLLLPHHSFRELPLFEAASIHTFFISIAWRACASKMPDMKEAYTDANHLELMRRALVDQNNFSPSFFPVSLTQITNFGETHNATPRRDTVHVPEGIAEFHSTKSWEIIRIYLDGLIAHVHLDPNKGEAIDNPLFVNSRSKTVISGVSYEASAQYEEILVNAWEVHSPLGTFKRT